MTSFGRGPRLSVMVGLNLRTESCRPGHPTDAHERATADGRYLPNESFDISTSGTRSPPQILLLALNLHEDLVDEECIAITTVSPFETTSISSTKFDTPKSDGFVANNDARSASRSSTSRLLRLNRW